MSIGPSPPRGGGARCRGVLTWGSTEGLPWHPTSPASHGRAVGLDLGVWDAWQLYTGWSLTWPLKKAFPSVPAPPPRCTEWCGSGGSSLAPGHLGHYQGTLKGDRTVLGGCCGDIGEGTLVRGAGKRTGEDPDEGTLVRRCWRGGTGEGTLACVLPWPRSHRALGPPPTGPAPWLSLMWGAPRIAQWFCGHCCVPGIPVSSERLPGQATGPIFAKSP